MFEIIMMPNIDGAVNEYIVKELTALYILRVWSGLESD